jgi:lipid-A-disaccharide synthase
VSRILIVCGEISGDLYAAQLAKDLKANAANLVVAGIGGKRLAEEVDEFVFDCADKSAIGVGALFQKMTLFKALTTSLTAFLDTHDVSRVVIIDFQHHNFKLAALVKARNISIITFITPNFWLWRDRRQARKLAAYSDKIVAIFEKEYNFYRELTPDAFYFGHPLLSLLNRDGFSKKPATDGAFRVTFFPGSRKQEMKLYLAPMLEIAALLKSQSSSIKFCLSLSAESFRGDVESHLKAAGLAEMEVTRDNQRSLFDRTDLLICASGTATLEAVLFKVPMIILAALPPLTYFLAKYVLRIQLDQVALPNIICQENVIPEYVQHQIRPKKIVADINLLRQDDQLPALLERYEKVEVLMRKTKDPIKSAAALILG